MNIDVKLLDKCPELTDYEKDLIRRIDVDHETQASVSKYYEKTPPTISIQHKKALERLTVWTKKATTRRKAPKEDFDKQAFKMFNKGVPPNKVAAKLGNPDRVFKLWEMHRRLMEDDYCRALNKIGEYGLEVSSNSKYPVTEQIDELMGENYLLSEEKTLIWNSLEEKGLTHGLEEDAYCSAHDGVKRLFGKLNQTEHALIDERNRKKAIGQELQEIEKKLSEAESGLKRAKWEIQRLERYKKYAHLSKERRKMLETDVADARALRSHLHEEIRELQNQKTELERQKTGLEREMCLRIDELKEVIFDLRTKAREIVMEFLLEMSPKEILNLALEARMYALVKPNPWLVEIAKSLQQTSRRA